jgi:hypothetical protein
MIFFQHKETTFKTAVTKQHVRFHRRVFLYYCFYINLVRYINLLSFPKASSRFISYCKAAPYVEDNPSSYEENIERNSGFLVFDKPVER